mmetsp:Transcript_29221/g.62137  ORF Transcript_29221/g.62137 Transcript_29221/m.62137 type:complete len:710 (-) Transcript_29221:113-2242(-)|eukprot:CAMPEP_0172318536 /NCGR_PEP_ID=MMETSP1058-20130122/35153_1 /TAXON_ID=83371 /ORGANISM="Detonula confervacea, Strain CCMP 353" /LENGTH=709 /DNA_ID=CAMNT_0013033389 /DNA_START=54 /DNA_END=2183 /DNA_ORIENTATION=+
MMAELSPVSSSIRRGPCHEDLSCRSDASVTNGCDNFLARHVSPASTYRCCDGDERTSQPQQRRNRAVVNNNENNNRSRCKRRRLADWSPSALVAVVAMTAVIATSITVSEAFAPSPLSPYMTSLAAFPLQPSSSSSLGAVHKRSGNHDMSRTSAAIAATRTSLRKKASTATAVTATPTMESAVASPLRRTSRTGTGGRKSNVFDQFTPEYMNSSPFDFDMSPPEAEPDPIAEKKNAAQKVNKSQILKNNKINLRLRSLLKDDTGEQEMEMFPDHSPEAAEQLADLKSYRISEEARRKANAAVSVDDEEEVAEIERPKGRIIRRTRASGIRVGEDGDEEASLNRVTLTPSSNRVVAAPKRRVVRATVKETGADSMSTYIKSLGQHELLTKDDEFLLGQQVRMLMTLEDTRHELEEELLRPPTFAQWAKSSNHTVPSLKQQIRRSQRAKAALIEANLRLVITVARQATKKSPLLTSHSPGSVQFQDACQQGIIGLTRATEKFDPELGFRFSTYAIWWIQKEVAKNVNEQSRSVRVPQSAIKKINEIRIQERLLMSELNRKPNDDEIAERVGMSLQKLQFYRQSANGVSSLDKKIDARQGKGSMSSGGDSGDGATMETFVKDTEHPSPSEMMDQQMMKDDIRRLVRTLSPREQAVIRLRFGLDDGKPLTLTDISAKFGVEVERIKKIETRALLKLRQPGRAQVVQCYVSDHT